MPGAVGAAQPGYAAAAQQGRQFQQPNRALPGQQPNLPYAQPGNPAAQPYAQAGRPYAQPGYQAGQQPYAGGQQPYGAGGYQASQAGSYGAGRYGGQSAHYSTQAPYYGAQPVAKKRTSKAPFIIIGAVLLVMIVGAVAVVASGILTNLFAPKSIMSALYEGTENLFYNTSSGTMEIKSGANFTVKWDFGDDLKSSVVWAYSGNTGFVLKDDTLIYYEATGSASDIKIVDEYVGIVAILNESAADTGVTVDFNKIVKNGKLDKSYIEQINKEMANASSDIEYFGSDDAELAQNSELITEIINDFMNSEVNKSKVQDKFMSGSSTDSSGGTTTYSGTINLVDLVNALGDYAYERGKDDKYAAAADEIVSACDSYSMGGEFVIEDFDIKVIVRDKVLTGLTLDINTSTVSLSVVIDITGLNSTDLSDDQKLNNIMNAPHSSPAGGGSGGGSSGGSGGLSGIF
jgi:uncharacterized membrane protein YgcG